MNRAQKGALCTLIASLFLILFGILLFAEVVILKNLFTSLHKFIALLLFSFMVPLFIFLRKKQSLAEVESDERDNLIIKRAILVSFVSVWIMLAAVCIIPRFIVGYTGSIAIWVLSLINFAIFLIAMFICSVAILIQYGWGGKKNKIENVKCNPPSHKAMADKNCRRLNADKKAKAIDDQE